MEGKKICDSSYDSLLPPPLSPPRIIPVYLAILFLVSTSSMIDPYCYSCSPCLKQTRSRPPSPTLVFPRVSCVVLEWYGMECNSGPGDPGPVVANPPDARGDQPPSDDQHRNHRARGPRQVYGGEGHLGGPGATRRGAFFGNNDHRLMTAVICISTGGGGAEKTL